MLTYLINVTTEIFTVSLLTGIILAFTNRSFGEKARKVVQLGILTGFIAAGIRAYATNTQRLVGGWKVGMYGYAAAVIIFAVFFIVFALYMKQKRSSNAGKTSDSAIELGLSAVIALLITACYYGALPNVMVYPFKFDIGTSSILSTDFLFRLGGYLLGIIICVTAGYAAYRIMTVASVKGHDNYLMWSFLAADAIYAIFSFARLMLVLTPRKIIDSPALFRFAAWSNNHYAYYTYALFVIILAVGIALWIEGRNAKEPYRTKAEHRKQISIWRSGRRFTVVAAICCVMSVLCVTWFVDLNTVEIREAPVEEAVIQKDGSGTDKTMVIPVEAVADGHMHRFGYYTDDGHLVRLIIVLKQEGTTNYGVGLDACDICGEAGYYENNEGQIVCKKCNVVMNRTTIGMKGGCNPIIIEYDFDGSNFTIPVEEMIKNKDKFSKG